MKRAVKIDSKWRLQAARRRKSILPSSEIPTIVEEIRTWKERDKMMWSDVIDIVERITKIRFTRQTLNNKTSIKEAYEAKNRSFAMAQKRKRVIKRDPAALHTAEALRKQILLRDDIITSQKQRIADQEERINKFLVMFSTWGTALLDRNDITADALNAPLPPARRSDTHRQGHLRLAALRERGT